MKAIDRTIDTFRYVIKNTINPIINIANFSFLFSFFNISLFFLENNFVKYNMIPTKRIAVRIYDIMEG